MSPIKSERAECVFYQAHGFQQRSGFFFLFSFLHHHVIKLTCYSAGSCRTSAGADQHGSSSSSHASNESSGGGSSKKVEVIDLTLDSSSDDEGQDSSTPPPPPLPPPAKRACPSMSPTSPPIINKGSEAHTDHISSNVEMRLVLSSHSGTSVSRHLTVQELLHSQSLVRPPNKPECRLVPLRKEEAVLAAQTGMFLKVELL